jgi:hypothetical protein
VDLVQIKIILKEAITPEEMSPQIARNLMLYEPLDSSAVFNNKSARYSICRNLSTFEEILQKLEGVFRDKKRCRYRQYKKRNWWQSFHAETRDFIQLYPLIKQFEIRGL